MTLPSPAATAPPSRAVVATATLATQLLGTIALAVALVWIVSLRVTEPPVIGLLVGGALAVFAGGNAHRGSVIALALCAAFDSIVAVTALARLPIAEAFAAPAAARIGVEPYLWLAMLAIGIVSALAAVTCLAALPQVRRFAAWRGEQILHAARVVRG